MIKIELGDKAPLFTGLDQNEKEINLIDYKGQNVILYFYPKDNTPGCTAEACDLRDNHDMWLSKGYAVIGVSADSVSSHKKFSEKYDLPFSIISDENKQILNDYGVWGEKNLYGKKSMGIKRTTFVINEEGVVINIFKQVKTKEHTSQILGKIKK